jgi:phage major head subunit gpT-like protein
MTRDNFAKLLSPLHSKIFFDQYKELGEQYSKVFAVEDMDMKQESEVIEGAFGLWDSNTEGNTINEDSMSEGDTITYTAARYDKGYEMTWELIQDDFRNVLKGKGKGGSAQALAKGLSATVETLAAGILNGGFTNTGYDGVALFSNSHPLADSASLFDNLTTGALTDANLKLGLTLARQTVDEAGVQVVSIPKKLIIPNELEFTAKQILMSTNVAGEMSNTKNTLPGLQLEIMDYLTSATAWFIQAAGFRNLVFKWREKPFFGYTDLQKRVDKFFYGFARMCAGYSNPRGLVGSTGL